MTRTTGGPHLVQTPGPTNVPGRILRRLAEPTIDHRGPGFQTLARSVLDRLPAVFGTTEPVVIFPSSGTGAWEAALVNTLSPGDRVLAFGTGHFATLWAEVATRLGLVVVTVGDDWRGSAATSVADAVLRADLSRPGTDRRIAAVLVVHNETSTGVLSDVDAIRQLLDDVGHPALLLVDTVSSLASTEVAVDRWRADVTVSASQKGLMLPPGLSFAAVGPRARAAAEQARVPRSYFDWRPVLAANVDSFFPYTPATNLLGALAEALDMLDDESLPAVFTRHERLATATRAAVTAWGLEVWCREPGAYSPTVSAVLVPTGWDAAAVNRAAYEHFGLSLGIGLGRTAGQVFRIGHLGHLNSLGLMATLAGVELALRHVGIAVEPGGLDAALAVLEQPPVASTR